MSLQLCLCNESLFISSGHHFYQNIWWSCWIFMMVIRVWGIICSLCASCLSVCRTESVAEKMLTNWFTFLLYKFLKVRPTTVHDDHILSLSVSFKQQALVKSEVDLYRASSYKVYLFVFLSGTFIKCSWLLLFIRFISLTLLIKRFFLFLPHLFSL